MLLAIPFSEDWAQIRLQKMKVLLDKGFLWENTSRIPCDYKVGEQVLLDEPGILRTWTKPRNGTTYCYKDTSEQHHQKKTRCNNWKSYNALFNAILCAGIYFVQLVQSQSHDVVLDWLDYSICECVFHSNMSIDDPGHDLISYNAS
jgi:hypothetical protein